MKGPVLYLGSGGIVSICVILRPKKAHLLPKKARVDPRGFEILTELLELSISCDDYYFRKAMSKSGSKSNQPVFVETCAKFNDVEV
jgi:hypothetical protein